MEILSCHVFDLAGKFGPDTQSNNPTELPLARFTSLLIAVQDMFEQLARNFVLGRHLHAEPGPATNTFQNLRHGYSFADGLPDATEHEVRATQAANPHPPATPCRVAWFHSRKARRLPKNGDVRV